MAYPIEKIINLKKIIVETAYRSKEGHIPSAFSILDVVWVLYDKILRVDPSNQEDPNRDYFILSKGHASLGLYAVLAEKGYFPFSEFDNFGKFDSILGGHPDRNKIPGVEASTGSLGHGLPISVGIALGFKIQKKSNRVYSIIGDGESNEGTIWESALLASHHNLSNLICVVDHNHSTDRALKICDMSEKFRAFGWNSVVVDGHDHGEILNALTNTHEKKPTAVIAKTIKGEGVKFIENNPAWHHKTPTEEEYEQIIAELNNYEYQKACANNL
ncbi:transketolase [Candidatus Falkowbacteria bacterium RIFOXYB2_FULL_47_14]|uniref:Transketolase n=1 Tax=Candidatus Falkowbacteria bacterium RIFOXYA2_FULL_47_19 TaxID=1797994 RepID=A0A1F5SHD1_9BACT|nr:MAG: transketolase [Candidatus Falkowbacteria bacterium RIFOXYA2_FULL_47_19]OGF35809.1 MAG: transketolase [Candidatus Falkowbacteria bacterium RIFOXYC2_FULL_46_15]OGF42682.1 MAG: transketolase [Candidatus Falkowbacteria bacterium RIFOXYB2_FULL_47_14]